MIAARAVTLSLCLLTAVTSLASDAWVIFGSALGYRSGCDPSYIWTAEPIIHNPTTADVNLSVLHQSGAAPLPTTLRIPAGTSAPLSLLAGGPPLALAAIQIRVPDSIVIEPRLEYANVLPCSGAIPPPGPSGKIAFPLFHLIDAQQPQRHYGLDLGIQSTRVNVGIYNAGTAAAVATITLQRPACASLTQISVVISPDTLTQVPVQMPAVCNTAVTMSPPWIVNATVVVDQPSFSYATVVSNAQSPNVTFGAAIQ